MLYPWTTALKPWIALLQDAPLECDGFCRVLSALLRRQSIQHDVHVGSVVVGDGREICPHFWITMVDGQICDYKARLWLGEAEDVPHGVFMPTPLQRYHSDRHVEWEPLHPVVFSVLAGRTIDKFPLLDL